MIEALTIQDIEKELSNYLRWKDSVNMVGLLFSRPATSNSINYIIPQLNDFHFRSGTKIHFFCIGYGSIGSDKKITDQDIIANVGGVNWYFGNNKFNSLRRDIECKTNWVYNGGSELLLMNISKRNELKVELILESMVEFNIDSMLTFGVIPNVETFFFEIFKFADSYQGTNATEDFTNPPMLENFPIQHSNVGVLTTRMNDCWRRKDFSGLLHACASIFETVAKHIIGKESINKQTLGSFFDLYKKKSALSEEQLNKMLEYYKKRNSVPLAGHGNIETPNITQDEAEDIYKFTSSIIRIEYLQYVKKIAA